MSNLSVNTITDASGGSTASINGLTPQASNMQPYNLIINGAMTVAQRGTSVTGSTAGAAFLTVDRFATHASGATYNTSQQSVALNGETGLPVQFTKFLRYNPTTGANNCGVWQTIEGVDSVQGTHTLSFYAKGTNPAGGFLSLDLRQYFGSGGSTSVDQDTITFSLTSDWQRYTFIITPPSISGKTIGASSYYRPFIKQPDADTGTAAWTLDITGVQLEAGSSASSFAHENVGDTLRKCQRYFEQLNGIVYGSYIGSFGASYSTWFFSTEKRTAPTMNFLGTTGTAQNVSTQSADVFASSTYPRIGAGTTASSEL